MSTASGPVPRWESSLAFAGTSAVAVYCNLARFGPVLRSREVELPLAPWPRDAQRSLVRRAMAARSLLRRDGIGRPRPRLTQSQCRSGTDYTICLIGASSADGGQSIHSAKRIPAFADSVETRPSVGRSSGLLQSWTADVSPRLSAPYARKSPPLISGKSPSRPSNPALPQQDSHHEGCVADRRSHTRGGTPKLSERDRRRCRDTIVVLCANHCRSSSYVIAE
jgi:hypothetical protein